MTDENEEDDEECYAEVWSWNYFHPNTIDPYWIKCTLLGQHDEHENSHTGLKWKTN